MINRSTRKCSTRKVWTSDWALAMSRKLEEATWSGNYALDDILFTHDLQEILEESTQILKRERTVVDICVPPGARINVVGDTHGQFHDLLCLFRNAGVPSDTNLFVFNGDFVDRGAWGVEVLTTLLCWKLSFPDKIFLLRGNHESTSCTLSYGFYQEVSKKYAASDWKVIYKLCKSLFSCLPLSAVIENQTLVLHGGLFRMPPKKTGGKGNKRKIACLEDEALMLGNMKALRAATKGGVDPDESKASSVTACDVLWSDPQSEAGLKLNELRGVGLLYGPDMTEQFLRENNLKLIIRSHEGPDSRIYREDMKGLQGGFAVDHDVESGKLITVFSAPDYPQFAEESERTFNKAAYVVLKHPYLSTPQFEQFEAVLPRPDVKGLFDLDEDGEE